MVAPPWNTFYDMSPFLSQWDPIGGWRLLGYYVELREAVKAWLPTLPNPQRLVSFWPWS